MPSTAVPLTPGISILTLITQRTWAEHPQYRLFFTLFPAMLDSVAVTPHNGGCLHRRCSMGREVAVRPRKAPWRS
jgi:hypothetical protein